ncbi:MAG TPA: phosphoribosylformylglycinamidine cyclo-ligase [Dehalococcoidia bacterium]|nr:phosphoribosylformylglycinamidine cyclo-ligase [Dehalococcoidia bacterium]
MMGETYARAGVDIDAKDRAIERIGKLVRSTLRPEVLSGVGFFGGLFEFKGYKNPALVSSIDQVGTKTKIANAMGKHDTVGIDIVSHCINDIFTCGAEPLFFLDYIGMGKMVPEKVEAIVQGLVKACREVGCALIGGETGEMAGLYATPDDYDLVGFVIGVVEKDAIIMGKNINIGDSLIGLPSSGLHTNGYSLVRKIFGETRAALDTNYPELGRTLGEELLEPHRCYYNQLKPLLPYIKGMAHITGGGLIENVPRVLPDGMAAHFDSRTWAVPPIFGLIQQRGNVDRNEMYRVFNMGLGMVVMCSPEHVSRITEALPEAKVVGEVVKQSGEARTVIE